jgi:hypothetical protein
MRYRICPLILMLLFVVSAGSTQTGIYTPTRTLRVLEEKGSLASDKREKLRFLATAGTVNPAFALLFGEKFRAITKAQFHVREDIQDTKTKTADRSMRVIYRCVYLEALEGPNKGKRGWAVLSREVVNRYTDEFAKPWVDVEDDDSTWF